MKYSIAAGLGALSLVTAAPTIPIPEKYRVLVQSDLLQLTLRTKALTDRAKVLQGFADATPGTRKNRVFGSQGHNKTVDYIYDTLVKTGNYNVEKQPFVAEFSDGQASFTANGEDKDGRVLSYSPNGDITAPLANVANLGCDAADFGTDVSGNIALIARGTCPFAQKVTNANAAGAVGAIIYNNVEGPLSSATLGSSDPNFVPTAGIAQADGQDLSQQITTGTVVTGHLITNSIFENRTTYNVIATTKGGDQNNIIHVGSHTDSVAAGPGINDNGSGTIALLELATKLALFKTNNAVRFGFWSAEEFGLLGAEHYVTTLPAAELDKIRLYLNFDMIASPNYVYGIYDGDGSAFNVSGPAGSAEAEKLFEDFYKKKKLPSVPSEFTGRSDYGPFLDAGIASGGLFTGAEVLKTEEEARLFGGEAGVAYDANYHQAGDTVANLNLEAFLVNAKAVADSIATYARSFKSLPPRQRRVVRKRDVHRHPGEIVRCGETIVAQ